MNDRPLSRQKKRRGAAVSFATTGGTPMYIFRVIADVDSDGWLCKRGSRVLARCCTAVDAVDRAGAEAALHRPSQVLYHDPDGAVSVLANYPAQRGPA